MPDALSLQYCNLSSENDLKAAILHRRAENIKNHGEKVIDTAISLPYEFHILTLLLIVANVF